ncbi:MAG TPA: protein-L-isoaspartate(D-aspartate) O-methyltransferase [Thermoanaerobaculia bacterium]|nr:protein-L-isoaspartate(D-aspartate) O-methyltransferase [Thermoanaerobaculia bacterium]
MDEVKNEGMLRDQIIARGISDPRVLAAFRSVPRELFVPPHLRASSYDDTPLPLDCGQTISQPFIVALMTQLLALRGSEKVLEIGTGSGYQTAILGRLARHVYSAEVERDLASRVKERLALLSIDNVTLGVGNGLEIFREHAPFDAILSAAAPEILPEELIDQLAEGGRCIIPVGLSEFQYLWLLERRDGEVTRKRMDSVRFVPLRS